MGACVRFHRGDGMRNILRVGPPIAAKAEGAMSAGLSETVVASLPGPPLRPEVAAELDETLLQFKHAQELDEENDHNAMR